MHTLFQEVIVLIMNMYIYTHVIMYFLQMSEILFFILQAARTLLADRPNFFALDFYPTCAMYS